MRDALDTSEPLPLPSGLLAQPEPRCHGSCTIRTVNADEHPLCTQMAYPEAMAFYAKEDRDVCYSLQSSGRREQAPAFGHARQLTELSAVLGGSVLADGFSSLPRRARSPRPEGAHHFLG